MTDPNPQIAENDEDKIHAKNIKIFCGAEIEHITTTNHAEWRSTLQGAWVNSDADWLRSGGEPESPMDEQ